MGNAHIFGQRSPDTFVNQPITLALNLVLRITTTGPTGDRVLHLIEASAVGFVGGALRAEEVDDVLPQTVAARRADLRRPDVRRFALTPGGSFMTSTMR